MDFLDELRWRGLISDSTPNVESLLSNEKASAYIGFDPTSRSLHVGNLLPIMGLVRLQRSGHIPIALVGGGTGLIGDPSGKYSERSILSKGEISDNLDSIHSQLEKFLDFKSNENAARIINNADWLTKINLTDFLRDIGKHFTINYMMKKESVKSRLTRETGISFTEFSYMTLQAYDFYHLHKEYNCKLQMGGSDQLGNILAGVDLINKKNPGEAGPLAHGIVFPLVTSSSGEKFGKSIGQAPTLDPEKTSPYKLYQFFLNTPDDDVTDYLKYFTLLDEKTITGLEKSKESNPKDRVSQKKLAEELVKIVHGVSGLSDAIRITDCFFNNRISDLSIDEIDDSMQGFPTKEISSKLLGSEIPIGKLLVEQSIFNSMGEARRMSEQGGLSINGEKINNIKNSFSSNHTIKNKLMVIKKGSKQFYLIKLI